MQRVMVGVDQSEAAGSAQEWAAAYALALNVEMIAFNAFQSSTAEVSPDDLALFLDERRDLMNGAWTAQSQAAGVAVHTIVRSGAPQDVLLEAAAAEEADLVVVGRSGRGGEPGLLHLSSLAEYCAHHSVRPLAVIPAGFGAAPRRIIVGVDGSTASLQAVTWSARLAEALGASITAVVIDTNVDGHRSATPHQIRQRVAAWASPLAGIGAKIDIVSKPDAHPAYALLGAAAEHDADLLVVGAHGVGTTAGVRLGGTALRALHHATIPFVMVPAVPRVDRS